MPTRLSNCWWIRYPRLLSGRYDTDVPFVRHTNSAYESVYDSGSLPVCLYVLGALDVINGRDSIALPRCAL